MPVCTSSKASKRPRSSQISRSAPEERRLGHADAALALHRLDQDAGGLGRDGALERGDVTQRNLVEAVHDGAEAVEMLLVLRRRERGQRPAVEAALEGDDAVALGMAVGRLIFADQLDDAFHGLRAGIREEHQVGKAQGARPVGQALAAGIR